MKSLGVMSRWSITEIFGVEFHSCSSHKKENNNKKRVEHYLPARSLKKWQKSKKKREGRACIQK